MGLSIRRLLLTALLAAPGVFARSNDKIDQMLAQLERVQHFGSVSISPDGAWVTWSEDSGVGKHQLFLKSRTGRGKPLRITAGDGKEDFTESGVVWSGDSTHFAFVSNATGSAQIYWTRAAEPDKRTQLTHVKGDIADLRWSPDGQSIAFLHTEGGNTGGPLAAVAAQTGVIGSGFENQRLAVVPAAGGAVREVTTSSMNIYEYSWAPSGEKFAAIAAHGPADNNWWLAKLYTVDAATGAMAETYAPPTGQQISVPRWSPDGSRIAFIAGIMSDEGFLGGDIFAVDASSHGSVAKDLTPEIKLSPNGLKWQGNGAIEFTASDAGGGAIAKLDLASGTAEMLWKGESNLHEDGNYPNFALADDGRTSTAVISTWEKAPEVWTGEIGAWKRVTDLNADAKPHWGKAESIAWSTDNFRAQGWLLYPEHFDPSKRYPMVVSIHGGPAGMRSPAWPSVHFDMSAMAGLGYFVFFPNPRGSYGGGEAFTKANVKDFGYGDLRDVLSGVDAVLQKAPVDANRIGVTGWSYGGYMTMWTVTQTHRFRAAVAGAGIADWLSYYGENSIDEWMIPYFGKSVYDDPKVYEKSSPITYIKNVKTPTLVVVGERDGECPAPQSFEFWHALKTEGVPTELLVYPGEGHSFRESKNRVDVMRRTLAWFDQYLGG